MTKPSNTQAEILAAAAQGDSKSAAAGRNAATPKAPKEAPSAEPAGKPPARPRGPTGPLVAVSIRRRAPAPASDRATAAAEPAAAPASAPTLPKGKVGALVDLLRQPGGTTVEAMMAATGWQAHSVRGALSGAIKKGLGLEVISEKTEAGRTYRVPAEVPA